MDSQFSAATRRLLHTPSLSGLWYHITMAESSSLSRRSGERPYGEDIELKGATSSATGIKNEVDSSSTESLEIMGHGEQDKLDMQRLGKKQEFKRNFSFWSALGFVGKTLTERV